jgi:peroxiredoxin Q/BCP
VAGPRVGERAPEFSLPATTGTVALRELIAEGAVLLVFYPGDDTPVCTAQLCDYRDHLATFSELGVRVVAINSQSLESHREFARKHRLPFPLASDPDRAVCRAYGAAGLLGLTKRALVLVDRAGVVRYARTDLPIFRRSAEELRDAISGLDLA